VTIDEKKLKKIKLIKSEVSIEKDEVEKAIE
jgi:hypothetical protein